MGKIYKDTFYHHRGYIVDKWANEKMFIIIRKTQIKTMRYHYTSIWMVKMKNSDTQNACKNTEKLDH